MVPVTPKLTTWSCKSEAGKKLVAGIANGDIEPTTTPKVVHGSDPSCLDCGLHAFRAALTRERAKTGSFLASRKHPGEVVSI